MATKSNKTGLNKKQIQLAEMLANPDFCGTVTQLCEQCGVARSTFYRWLDQPEFRAYLDGLISKYADSELAAVWKALLRRCGCGDIQAIKLYFELRERTTSSHAGVQIIDDL